MTFLPKQRPLSCFPRPGRVGQKEVCLRTGAISVAGSQLLSNEGPCLPFFHTWENGPCKHLVAALTFSLGGLRGEVSQLFFKRFFFISLFRERGKEGESEGEKHQVGASCPCSTQGLGPHPRHVPWPGIEPVTFCFTGWAMLARTSSATLEQKYWTREHTRTSYERV